MSEFKRIENEVTGAVEFQFTAELVSVNTTAKQSYTNAAGEEKSYYLGTINFKNAAGVEVKGKTTSIYAKSFEHGMKPGNSYLSTVSQSEDGKMWIRTSHLASGFSNATAEDFGLDFAVATSEAPAVATAL